MPAATAIVINDGAGSPVSHTFTPIGKDDKGVMWFEQTIPAPTNILGAKRIGYKQARNMAPGSVLNRTSKVTLTLALPTIETMSVSDAGFVPAPQIAYTEKARVEFDLADRSGKQERKDTRVLTSNLLTASQIVTAIDDLQPMYGG